MNKWFKLALMVAPFKAMMFAWWWFGLYSVGGMITFFTWGASIYCTGLILMGFASTITEEIMGKDEYRKWVEGKL